MWAVLKSFDSEGEARVVESFLKANGIQAQVLGTHANYSAIPTLITQGKAIRLLVNDGDVEAAHRLLEENARATHLEIADDPPPEMKTPTLNWRADKIIIVLLLLLTAAFFAIRSFRP